MWLNNGCGAVGNLVLVFVPFSQIMTLRWVRRRIPLMHLLVVDAKGERGARFCARYRFRKVCEKFQEALG